MAKENIKKNCGPVYYSVTVLAIILMIASDFIYWWLPSSELANGIEHSGMEAVYVLFAASAASALALISYVGGSIADKAIISNSVVQKIIFVASVVGIGVSAAITIAFTVFSNSLGFVAPTDGTSWHTLGIVSAVMTLCFIGANIYIFIAGKKN